MPTLFQAKGIKFPKYDAKAVERAIRDEKKDKGGDIVKELEKTTVTWDGEKPGFRAKVNDSGNDMIIEIDLTGSQHGREKWVWLNRGTEPHVITGNPRLTFIDSSPEAGGTSYVPKTIPGQLMSRVGADATGPLHFPEMVIHPGFPAREWTKAIIEKKNEEFKKRIRLRLRTALRD